MDIRARFNRAGLLALQAEAWGAEYATPELQAATGVQDPAIISIRGPLTHHPDGVQIVSNAFCAFDSYDAIRERVRCAAANAKTIVLKIDSPGGDAAGMLELAHDIREMCKGKRTISFVDGCAASAAYAIACSMNEIIVTPGAMVGSVGVIQVIADNVRADQAMGLNFAVITSGARKADANPHTPITDEMRAAIQAQVDLAAETFFALVSGSRRLSVDKVKALEAALVRGPLAVTAGLADTTVESFDTFLESLKSNPQGAQAMTYDEALKGLKNLAKEDSEDGRKAKDALSKFEAEADPNKEPDGDEEKKAAKAKAEADEKEKAKALAAAAEDDKDKAKAETDEKEKAKAAIAAANATAITALIASRPDLPEATRKALATKSLPEVQAFCELAPKAPAVYTPPGQLATAPTQGGQPPTGARADAQAQADAEAMRVKFGRGAQASAPYWDGRDLVYPAGAKIPSVVKGAN